MGVLVFFGFHRKLLLEYFGSDCTFALVSQKHTDQNTFKASSRYSNKSSSRVRLKDF